jgi:hypothetical protein
MWGTRVSLLFPQLGLEVQSRQSEWRLVGVLQLRPWGEGSCYEDQAQGERR